MILQKRLLIFRLPQLAHLFRPKSSVEWLPAAIDRKNLLINTCNCSTCRLCNKSLLFIVYLLGSPLTQQLLFWGFTVIAAEFCFWGEKCETEITSRTLQVHFICSILHFICHVGAKRVYIVCIVCLFRSHTFCRSPLLPVIGTGSVVVWLFLHLLGGSFGQRGWQAPLFSVYVIVAPVFHLKRQLRCWVSSYSYQN